jgi:hypothetical protein
VLLFPVLRASTVSQATKTQTVHRSLSCLQVLRWLHTTLHKHAPLSPQGMRIICVLTKADMVDGDVHRETAHVEKSLILHQMRQCVMQKAGLPLNQVRTAALTAAIPVKLNHQALCHVLPLVYVAVAASGFLVAGDCPASLLLMIDLWADVEISHLL